MSPTPYINTNTLAAKYLAHQNPELRNNSSGLEQVIKSLCDAQASKAILLKKTSRESLIVKKIDVNTNHSNNTTSMNNEGLTKYYDNERSALLARSLNAPRKVVDNNGQSYSFLKEHFASGYHSQVSLVKNDTTGKLYVIKEPKIDEIYAKHIRSVIDQNDKLVDL